MGWTSVDIKKSKDAGTQISVQTFIASHNKRAQACDHNDVLEELHFSCIGHGYNKGQFTLEHKGDKVSGGSEDQIRKVLFF